MAFFKRVARKHKSLKKRYRAKLRRRGYKANY